MLLATKSRTERYWRVWNITHFSFSNIVKQSLTTTRRISTGKVTRGTIPYFHIAKHLALLGTEGREERWRRQWPRTSLATLTYPHTNHIYIMDFILHSHHRFEWGSTYFSNRTERFISMKQPYKRPNRDSSRVSQARASRFRISHLLIRLIIFKTRKLTL